MDLTKFKSTSECQNYLKKKGFIKIGSGSFSDVYARSRKARYVIKINKEPDDALRYLDWGHKKKSKFAPKIISKKKFRNGTYIVQMERVNKCTKREFDLVDDALSITSNYYSKEYNDKKIIKIEKRFKGIIKFLKEYRRKFRYSIDIHPDNVGKRNDNHLVIFDPYVGDIPWWAC